MAKKEFKDYSRKELVERVCDVFRSPLYAEDTQTAIAISLLARSLVPDCAAAQEQAKRTYDFYAAFPGTPIPGIRFGTMYNRAPNPPEIDLFFENFNNLMLIGKLREKTHEPYLAATGRAGARAKVREEYKRWREDHR